MNTESEILDVLWQSLKGGNYDLDAMKPNMQPDARFDDLGIDSLDMTDFFIRIEERYKIKIRQEDYPSLHSVRVLQQYVERHHSGTSH